MRKKHKHKWKYQINVKKKILVLLVLGVSLFVGLGYAIIGSDLGIVGTLEIRKYDKTLYDEIVRASEKGYGLKYNASHQDSIDSNRSTDDIYYYYASTEAKGLEIRNKNNVVFAGMCWQMIRTTDTGGVRMLYNGEPEITYNNGEMQYNCGTDRDYYHLGDIKTTSNLNATYLYGKNYTTTKSGNKVTFTLVNDPDDPDDTYSIKITSENAEEQIAYIAENYPYTCRNTSGTCTTSNLNGSQPFYRVASYNSGTAANVYTTTPRDSVATSAYNTSANSPAYVGYMYGDVYTYDNLNPTATKTFDNNRRMLNSSYLLLNSSTITLGTTYYYSATYDWNDTNPNQYTLTGATQIDGTTDYNTLVGMYLINNGPNGATMYYVAAISGTNKARVKSLTNGNTDVSIVFADNLTSIGGDTLDNPSSPIELKDYYVNYANYKNKYTCGNSDTTCVAPKFTTTTSATSFYFMSGNITISKSRNGLDLDDYVTIDLGAWYRDYNTTYADYKYTCGNTDTTCTSSNLVYMYNKTPTVYNYVYISDITIAKSRNGLELSDYVTIGTDQWCAEYNTTYADYKYTCGNTDTTCTSSNLKYIYSRTNTNFSYIKNYNLGTSVIYEDNKYKLQNVVGLETLRDGETLSTHHYICLDIGSTECQSVAYIFGFPGNTNGTYGDYAVTTTFSYITLNDSNVTSVQTALDNMLTKNTTESNAKKLVDEWYERKLKDTQYEVKVDDTIYCSDRSFSLPTLTYPSFEETGWNASGGKISKRLYFKESNRTTDLSCTNVTDRFSVSNDSAKLKYKTALISVPEIRLLNQSNVIQSTQSFWYMSPDRFDSNDGAVNRDANATSGMFYVNNTYGVRPAISLVKGTKYIRGNGSMTDPYVVDSDVRMNKWTQTQLSGTTVTSSSATTTISTIGSTTNGNDLSTIEYYTTCSSGTATGSLNNPETATIRNNSAATITLNACPGAVLHYRIKDTLGNYSDGWNVINDIAQYMLYAQVYNEMTYAGGVASNNEKNLTFWVNNNNYSNTAHRLISMAYYDEDSEATVEDLDTTTLVERAYPTFLGREADSTKTTWINAIDGGSETIESFFLSFINSTEAKNIRGAWGLDTTEYHP